MQIYDTWKQSYGISYFDFSRHFPHPIFCNMTLGTKRMRKFSLLISYCVKSIYISELKTVCFDRFKAILRIAYGMINNFLTEFNSHDSNQPRIMGHLVMLRSFELISSY